MKLDILAIGVHPDDVELGCSGTIINEIKSCLLYTSDAADDLLCVDLGGRRIIEKKKNKKPHTNRNS